MEKNQCKQPITPELARFVIFTVNKQGGNNSSRYHLPSKKTRWKHFVPVNARAIKLEANVFSKLVMEF